MKKISLSLVILGMLLASCVSLGTPDAAQNGIEIYDARIPLPGGEMMSGDQMVMMSLSAFMIIKNTSDSADRLVAVSSDFADASLHETIMERDVMKMEAINGLDIPAGDSVVLMNGTYHIMLMNPMKALKVGDTVTLVLEFEKAGKISVPAQVVKQ